MMTILEKILQLDYKNMTVNQIVDALDCNPSSVRSLIVQHKIKCIKRKPAKKEPLPEIVIKIKKLPHAKMTISEISHLLAMNGMKIRTAMLQYGLKFKKG